MSGGERARGAIAICGTRAAAAKKISLSHPRARAHGRHRFAPTVSVAVVKCIDAEVDFDGQTSSPLIERGYKIRPRESSCIHHLGVKFTLSASGLKVDAPKMKVVRDRKFVALI